MRKYNILLLITILISIASFAQQGINYKALIKDDLGNVISNDLIVVQFQILQGVGMTNVYQETHTQTTDSNGFIVINIGGGSVNSGIYNAIDWVVDDHFLNVQINTGAGFIDVGTTQFMAVPYAKHAETAETANNVFSGDYNDLTNQPTTLPTGLEQITENDGTQDNTGWRLKGVDPANYGPIGVNAVDLSFATNGISGATGDFSTSLGTQTAASGDHSTAMGLASRAIGDYSISMGFFNVASGESSTSLGNNTTAIGNNSTSMGINTIATAYASTAIGKFSEADVNGLFIVGNGTSTSNRNNALIIKEDGKVGIGRNTPSSLFEVYHQNGAPTSGNRTNAFSVRNVLGPSWQFYTQSNGNLHLYNNGDYRGAFLASSGAYVQISDRKLKKDITSLESGTLNKVMQLNPVSYLMKDQIDSKRNLGLISQEVKELFPSITNYVEESDLLALSYTELIPILIKAIQEQQAIIENQNNKIEQQSMDKADTDKTLQALLKRIEAIEGKQSN